MPRRLVREHLLAALLASPEEGILGVSLDGAIEIWSQNAERFYGYTAQEITGQPLSRLVPLHEWPGLKSIFSEAAGNDSRCFETTERLHKDGSRIFLKVKRVLIRDEQGEVTGILERGRALNSYKGDETDERPLRLIIEQMPGLLQARHDALTGLANYREFMDRLEREVCRAERNHRAFTLLLLDLDGLKRINDLLGHLAGNRALKRLAAVMNEHCRSTDLAVRYGGDEFAVADRLRYGDGGTGRAAHPDRFANRQ